MKAFLDKLAELDAPLNPPATEEQIQKAEQRIGIQLPEPLRELYRCFNGTSGEFTDTLWLFYPLETVGTIRQLYPETPFPNLPEYGETYPDQYIIFADALIGAPLYAICADPESLSYRKVILFYVDTEFAAYPSTPSFERFQEVFLTQHSGAIIGDV